MTTAATATTEATEVLPRRERLRQATMSEIRATAHRLLIEGGDEALTLRAVARAMGMTAPGLYRYVDSHEELVKLVAADCYGEVVEVVSAARDEVPAAEPARRLIEMARAFRRWSIEHRREFGLVFANPVTGLSQDCETELDLAGQRFGQAFAETFIAAVGLEGPHIPRAEDIDPFFAAKMHAVDPAAAEILPLGLNYLFVLAWVRLYGTVCMEVFGHLGWAVDDGEAVFEDQLRDLCERLGIPYAKLASS